MSKRAKSISVLLISFTALVAFIALKPKVPAFVALQLQGISSAGTWEDDPKNWYRAFNEAQPEGVKVIHSKYWRSNHFTEEHIYHFEVEATPDWKNTFLQKRGLIQVAPSVARAFRTNHSESDVPNWFAPGSVDLYEVWDIPGYYGSVWINKTNGHIHFFEWQL